MKQRDYKKVNMIYEYLTLLSQGNLENDNNINRMARMGWEVISSNAFVQFGEVYYYALLRKPLEEKE